MSRFQAYSEGCKRLNVENPYENEEAFNRAYGIEPAVEEIPVCVGRKSEQPTVAQVEIVKALKRKTKSTRTRKVITSEEERKSNRTRWMREKREDWKAQGLSCRGTPYKVTQKSHSPQPVNCDNS